MGRDNSKEPEKQVGEKLSKIDRKTLKSEEIKKDEPPRRNPPRQSYEGRHRQQGG